MGANRFARARRVQSIRTRGRLRVHRVLVSVARYTLAHCNRYQPRLLQEQQFSGAVVAGSTAVQKYRSRVRTRIAGEAERCARSASDSGDLEHVGVAVSTWLGLVSVITKGPC